MWSMMNYFGGRRDPKQSAREAIVGLREQLLMNDKKEEMLLRKIDDAKATARTYATTNEQKAKHALRQKKMWESELDRLASQKLQLEMQVNTLEGANMNAETMAAMKKGAEALKTIHSGLNIDKVEQTMADIEDQRQLAEEVSRAIASPAGDLVDEDELKDELEQLQQEELDKALTDVPAHIPSGVSANRLQSPPKQSTDEDMDRELRELQAEMAM